MEPKRELTSVDLVALVGELREYTGVVVDKAYLYGDDLIRLKMRDFEEGRVELLLQVGDVKRAHVARPEHVPDAPGRPPNFAKMLRNRISGAKLARVEQYGFDRILEFEFRREDQDTTVVAELFGQGNVAVLDQNGEVVDCLETVRLKSRTVAPGSRYEFPSARAAPRDLSFDEFAARMRDSDTDIVRTLATQLDFGGLYGEELCTRAGVEKTRDIADVSEAELERVYDAIGRLFDALEGDLDPRVYYEERDENGDGKGGGDASGASTPGRRVDVTPVPLEERAALRSEPFDAFNEALDDYFTNVSFEGGGDGGGDAVDEPTRPEFEEEIAKRERIVEQQEGAIEGFEEQAEDEREKAELLYGNYALVDEILSTVREARAAGRDWEEIESRFAEGRERGIDAAEAVAGVNPEAGTVTVRLDDRSVELDPGEGVEHNADRLYTEAKRIEEKREGALEALEETRAELEEVKRRREEWEAGDDGADAAEDDGDEAEVNWLSRPSIPVRQKEQWYERFRWFRTSDGFLVIGGRDAKQNEEVVEKYMDGYDRFFHAQAHGGPATVLKTTMPSEPSEDVDVPDASLEQAAQFAVSYSSVWKDGRFSGDAYAVSPDQVTKTPESGEFLDTGGFAIRGDRTYFEDTPVGCAVGITCEPETRVVGGPPAAVREYAETIVEVEPGRYAQGDVAKRVYRQFRERFADTSFVRKVASPDLIQHFLPPGTSRIKEE